MLYRFNIDAFKDFVYEFTCVSDNTYEAKVFYRTIKYICKQHDDYVLPYCYFKNEMNDIVEQLAEIFDMNEDDIRLYVTEMEDAI